jgi:hypothetical protein
LTPYPQIFDNPARIKRSYITRHTDWDLEDKQEDKQLVLSPLPYSGVGCCFREADVL